MNFPRSDREAKYTADLERRRDSVQRCIRFGLANREMQIMFTVFGSLFTMSTNKRLTAQDINFIESVLEQFGVEMVYERGFKVKVNTN